jgi:DNA mismatch repair protein MSH4
MLDMLLCFALVAHEEDYVKPEISDTLALRNSRHPILEKVSSTPVVPNDCYVDESVRFQIVTGPNMSGKSIYLNQIAIILVMAQLGCYVPCDYASIRISTKLLTRIGHDDGRHAEMSSFTEEMRDAMFILQQCNDSSMVIIDELGRGTSTADGIALTIAVSEELLKTKSFILLATHFSEVGDVFNCNPYVVCLNLKVTVSTDNLQMISMYDYKIDNGITKVKHYGIDLARKIGFSDSIISIASEVSQYLKNRWRQMHQSNLLFIKLKKEEIYITATHELIKVLKHSVLDQQMLYEYLERLQISIKEKLENYE